MSTGELLATLYRYDTKREVKINRRKLNKINLKKIAKKQNISRDELRKAEKLQNKSIDKLKEIAGLRRIKNYDNLTKDLIFSLLISESNTAEQNYMEYFNNSTNDETKSKINDIKLILSRLGNIVTKNDRKKFKKSFMK